MLFPTVAGMVGLFLGTAEGLIVSQSASGRAVWADRPRTWDSVEVWWRCSSPRSFFSIMQGLMFKFWKNPQNGQMPDGLALLILMMGRASAWAVAAIPAGLGQGFALRSRKVALNGLVGGCLVVW